MNGSRTAQRIGRSHTSPPVAGAGGQIPRVPVLQRNGAGGIRTPVPGQSAQRFYACSRCFHLGHRTAIDSVPMTQPTVKSRPLCLTAPRAGQPDDRRSAPHRASGADRAACIRPRERTACWQLLVLHAFYEACMLLDAPRCTFPARSKTGSAPDVKEARPAWGQRCPAV